MDIRKAFDSVSHTILLNKLSRMGFRGNVEVNGCKSQNREIDYGVPQDSVPGPLFFILSINAITSVRCDGKELFAYDGVFWNRDICFSKLILRLNNLLADLRNWLYTNKKIEYLPDLYFCRDLLKYR